jgi:hypothetical protein
MSQVQIESPDAFFHLCNGLHGDSIANGLNGMVTFAVRDYLKPVERPICRAFIHDVLERVIDDARLASLLKNCNAEIWISKPIGARIMLQQALVALDQAIAGE